MISWFSGQYETREPSSKRWAAPCKEERNTLRIEKRDNTLRKKTTEVEASSHRTMLDPEVLYRKNMFEFPMQRTA